MPVLYCVVRNFAARGPEKLQGKFEDKDFHIIGSVVFIDTLSFMHFFPQSSVNN